jgi:predicted ferric reductase
MLKKISTGATIIILSVITTLVIWLTSKSYYNDWFADPLKYIAKTSSLTATILFSWSMILSARFRWLEDIFGGLDKVYTAHKYVGIFGFLIVFLHPIFLAAGRLPNLFSFLSYFGIQNLESSYWVGHFVGIVAIILLITLVYASASRSLPYHIWKKTHEWMTLFYGLVIVHILLVNADIAKYPALGVWMYSITLTALFCGLYIRFVYPYFGPRYEYEVESIEKLDSSSEIWLKPKNKPIIFKPSQWVYVTFFNDNISNEPHPFSIASAPSDSGRIKLGVKHLGDFTSKLNNLNDGDKVIVHGPYGKFSDKFLLSKKKCIFIGAGIGITPFLGMWDYALHSDEIIDGVLNKSNKLPSHINQMHDWKSPCISLFYVVDNEHEASFDNDIKRIAIHSKYKGFDHYENKGHYYELYQKNVKKAYINADYINSKVDNLKDSYIFLCGPQRMVQSLIKQLQDLGIKQTQIITEDFNLKGLPFSLR